MLKSFLVFTLLGAFLSACPSTETIESTRVTASSVYQEYSISASKNRTKTDAVFRVGGEMGKTIDLDAPSKIELNGKSMTELAPGFMSGTTYHSETENFVAKQQLTFTDANGKVYQNEIALAPLEIAGANKLVLSKSKPVSIKLSRAVAQNEEITISVSGKSATEKTDSSKGVEAALDETRTTATIDPESLKEFAAGNASVDVLAMKKESLKQATPSGGVLKTTYVSETRAAKIVN